MKSIALWPCGGYGRYLYSKKAYWKDSYRFSALVDEKAGQDLEGSAIPLVSPDVMKNMYKSGEIAGCVLTCGSFGLFDILNDLCLEMEVPVLKLAPDVRYISMDSSRHLKDCYCTEDNILKVSVLDKTYGIPCLFYSADMMCLYNEEGQVYKESWEEYHELRECYRPLCFEEENMVHITKACVLTKENTSGNYCHFVCEVITLLQLMEESGFDGTYVVFDSNFAREYFALMGIPESRIEWIGEKDDDTVYCFKSLYFPHYIFERNPAVASVLKRSADYIISKYHFGEITKEYPRRIFVRRIGTRKLQNAEELLAQYGFVSMIPEENSVLEQLKFFYAADLILCPHGAAGVNAIFLRKNATFIETFGHNYLMPEWYVYMLRERGAHYRMLSESLDGKSGSGIAAADYEINEGLFRITIEDVIGSYLA